MHIRHGKRIDGSKLKAELDKTHSINQAKQASSAIRSGIFYTECPICGSLKHEPMAEVYGFQYRKCLSCGTLFVSNPPSEDDLNAAYRSTYYSSENKILYANDRIIDYRVQQIAIPKFEFIEPFLTTSKKKWLDVGCGVGEVLSIAKEKGFECMGLEANSMERQYGIKHFGLTIQDLFISETTLSQFTGYGVISMFNVLEHLLKPHNILSDISKLQSIGDNLIVDVPHFPSISTYSQLTFPDDVNRNLHPPFHLFMFSLPSLTNMLLRHGYKVRAAWFFGLDFYEVFSTMCHFLPKINGSLLYQKLIEFIGDFQQAIDDKEMSDEVLVVAEKVRS